MPISPSSRATLHRKDMLRQMRRASTRERTYSDAEERKQRENAAVAAAQSTTKASSAKLDDDEMQRSLVTSSLFLSLFSPFSVSFVYFLPHFLNQRGGAVFFHDEPGRVHQ